jgi:hypothetical protein
MATQATARLTENDWTKPQAMAIPKEGYFNLERDGMAQSFLKLPPVTGFQSSQR